MTSRTLRRGLAAVAVLTGLAVSGCGAHPGAAAVVNGERISENEVARAIEDFTMVTGQPVDAPMMLGTLIVAPIMVDVAAGHGIAASDAEAAALLERHGFRILSRGAFYDPPFEARKNVGDMLNGLCEVAGSAMGIVNLAPYPLFLASREA